jgi:hypothetical protein
MPKDFFIRLCIVQRCPIGVRVKHCFSLPESLKQRWSSAYNRTPFANLSNRFYKLVPCISYPLVIIKLVLCLLIVTQIGS